MSQRPTMGAYLRAARRRRRVSIDRAAEDTKIRADFLMRMESDEFDFLAPAYVRGFLKTYARYMRVDPEPLLAEFDHKWGGGHFDTGQLVALDRRGAMTAPKEPRRMSNWTLAALFAGGLLALFAVIGVIVGPEEKERPADQLAQIEESPTKSPTKSPKPSKTATPTPTPSETVLAVAEGIDLEITASTAECWVLVTADGVKAYSGTMALGETRLFSAESEMELVLGFPEGVELIVNGNDLGSPGGVDPITLKFPDDLEVIETTG
ncbi:MAG: helix-turn-helix domain-containing protein [Actinomycetota bacterium]